MVKWKILAVFEGNETVDDDLGRRGSVLQVFAVEQEAVSAQAGDDSVNCGGI